MSGPYDDIIDLPHHVSKKRSQMSRTNRAAQFAPFAALTGYDTAIAETGRLTDGRIELDESAIAELDSKLRILIDHLDERPAAAITYFEPDEKKAGGAYTTAKGNIKKIDDFENTITFVDGRTIPIDEVVHIESKII